MLDLEKKPRSIEHRSIKYAVNLQNAIFISLFVCILCFIGLFTFTDPYKDLYPFVIFWGISWVFFTGIICYFQFYWYFSYKAAVIYSSRVNLMLARSGVLSALSVYSLVLVHTNQANFLNLFIVLILFSSFFYLSSQR